MNTKLTILGLALMFLSSVLIGKNAYGQSEAKQKLNNENYQAWQKHIVPTEQELAWTKIAWLPDLKSGIEAASKNGKPILLWTMNGHPFGCT